MGGKRFVEIDRGKRTYEACVISQGRKKRWNGTTDETGKERLIQRLQPGDVVAMQAGTTAFQTARRVIGECRDVRLVILNPGKLTVIYAFSTPAVS